MQASNLTPVICLGALDNFILNKIVIQLRFVVLLSAVLGKINEPF